jgi:hypothetical protein
MDRGKVAETEMAVDRRSEVGFGPNKKEENYEGRW